MDNQREEFNLNKIKLTKRVYFSIHIKDPIVISLDQDNSIDDDYNISSENDVNANNFDDKYEINHD